MMTVGWIAAFQTAIGGSPRRARRHPVDNRAAPG